MKIWIVTLLFVLLAASGRAQSVGSGELLAAARDLYAGAEYDRALTILDRLPGDDLRSDDHRSVLQYRAYCLIALGRASDAERAIEAVVTADPLDRNAAADMSPRVQSAFREVRRRMLPAVVQERYRQAKTAYDSKDFAGAAVAFEVVLKAMADPDIEALVSQPPLADLRMLAGGFHDLSVQAARPAPLPTVSQMSVNITAGKPVKIYSLEDPGIVPPAPLRQSLPQFPAQLRMSGSPGVLEIVIDETGAVESAIVRVSISPKYDGTLVEAAKKWIYQPGTRQGVPVKYRKMVQIDVQH